MKKRGIRVLLTTIQRGVNYFALASYPKAKDIRPRPGRGHDRETAIADALHKSRIFYAGQDVENEVLRAESLARKMEFVLEGDTLHTAPPLPSSNYA